MSNAPRVNFEILKHMAYDYNQTTPDTLFKGHEGNPSTRAKQYFLERELTALDFIQDELRALLNDAKNRAQLLAEQLDNEV